jgi:ER degradation enhancer, mannosidase alpha-like 2
MPARPLNLIAALALAALLWTPVPPAAAATAAPALPPVDDAQAAQLAQRVKQEFLHAWSGYREYAWGHDALKPLSHGARDWYGQTLLMTPVDALDTMLIMGLDEQARATRELVATQLSFDKDLDVKHFEIVIRLLGGLLSSYQLTHDVRLLKLADDLGTRMLPAFDSPTGLPYVYVNLRTGHAHGNISNPAESALLIEYGTLARLTGKPLYYEKAKRALRAIYTRRSPLDLVGERIDVTSGEWTSTQSHIGARIDSYYEYLWKCWRLFGDRECHAMWERSSAAARRYYADEFEGLLWYGQVDMRTGQHTGSEYGSLEAFFAGQLAFSGHLADARRLHAASIAMWNLHGVEPEAYDYRAHRITDPGYALRPEIVESTWYLYRLSGDPYYRAVGARLFEDFVRCCRSAVGYAALSDVTTKTQTDDMESFVMAETFKYFYLLFAPPATLDPQVLVLNTEAHPLKRSAPEHCNGTGDCVVAPKER